MKLILTLLLAACAAVATGEDTPPSKATWVDRYEALLQKYVTPTGVRYRAWHQSPTDRKELTSIITAIGNEKLAKKKRHEKLAFYLNAYNANILDRILKDYPTKGPGGGGLFGRNRFFKRQDLWIAGQSLSFDQLENAIIRPQFNEPRIHFALNCASSSCPPLHPKAFRAVSLNQALDTLTKAFVNQNASGVHASGQKAIAVSKIFDWYEEDFKPAGGVLAYINQYRTSPFPEDTKVSYQKYHWTLNESK